MITDEELDGIRAAQKAITKLDAGSPIVSGSVEHLALTWAVVLLSNKILTREISPEELEKIREYCRTRGIIQ